MDTPWPATDSTMPLGGERQRLHADENDEGDEAPQRKAKVKRARRECITCCSDVAINRFPKAAHTDSVHDRGVCFDCWERHLAAEVESKTWDAVSCAVCEHVLEQSDIKKLASGKIYQQWLDKAAKACQENDEEFRACPLAECSWGCFFSTKEDGNIFTCQMCRYRLCVVCAVPMHEGETCGAYQERITKEANEQANEQERKAQQAVENAASEKTVSNTSKACPNCTVRLDKYTGCDHVTCKRCRHQFCWICFVPYGGPEGIVKVGNSAHQSTCRYHTARLPNYNGG